MLRWCVPLLVLAALLALAESKTQTQVNINYANILRGLGNTPIKVLKAQGLSVFAGAVQASDLRNLLHTDSAFTIFAPTNAALNALTNPSALELSTTPALSRRFNQILKYHVVQGAFRSTDLTNGTVLTTLEGSRLTVLVTGTNVTLIDATGKTVSVTVPNVAARSGTVIHVINGVLAPRVSAAEFLRTDNRFTNLYSLLDTAGFLDALGSSANPITLFAPTDTAFATSLPAGVTVQSLQTGDLTTLRSTLLYHVWAGANALTGRAASTLTMGNGLKTTFTPGVPATITDARNGAAQITGADTPVSNGFVNPISRVLLF